MDRTTFNSKLLLPFVMVLVACGSPEDSVQLEVVSGVSLELARHRAATISNLAYELTFEIPQDKDTDIGGSVSVSFDLADNSQPLQLDFREEPEHVLGVVSNGTQSAYEFRQEHIVIPVADLNLGRNVIDIDFVAGSTSLNRNPDYLFTLFVPDRARTAFPLFDQPDLKATYRLALNVPAGWAAMANAPVESIEQADDRTRYRFGQSDLISSYLFSFVAGTFESVTQERNGRSMTMLHRETDAGKVARNIDAIFDLHAASIAWLEEYTGIAYPYKKFGFALIPAFQYGGMEHVGAIQYRASSLFLDESPSDTELLGRAGLIAHETAHMWFGDLVTMQWFNDVWTKEVFANFMAAKIVNPGFPDIDHNLNFLVRHYPGAYGVDRSEGANPIRQDLDNLKEAGQMYGAIIYNKAPIMMRQLELIVGEQTFREGMQDYLQRFAFANATWPDLIQILDGKVDADLTSWSEVWVNTAGRPEFAVQADTTNSDDGSYVLLQHDPASIGRVWPQRFSIRGAATSAVVSATVATPIGVPAAGPAGTLLFNSDGLGYGLFPADPDNLDNWSSLGAVEKGSELINVFENILEGRISHVAEHFLALLEVIESEQDQLLLNLAIGQASRIHASLMTVDQQVVYAREFEDVLWRTLLAQQEASKVRVFFKAYARQATSPEHVQRVYETWSRERQIEKLALSEDDYIELAGILAIRLPEQAVGIIQRQLSLTSNPDSRRRLEFVTPSLSPDAEVRDEFFASLSNESNRQTESWVIDALHYLHHPARISQSEKYIAPSLELLQEIQMTGDIFFPTRWLDGTLANHRSATAVATVRRFLRDRPDYNAQLRMKILQQADMLFRANAILVSINDE